MNKHLLRFIYLTRNLQPVPVTTANLHNFVNKIPIEEEDFFRATPAELHVIQELQEYPISVDLPEE